VRSAKINLSSDLFLLRFVKKNTTKTTNPFQFFHEFEETDAFFIIIARGQLINKN